MKKTHYSNRKFKEAFSREATKTAINLCEKVIKKRKLRKDIVAFIKAADGKKIRNTSGI